MRLEFNILWIEDQVTAVQAQRERIDFLVRKEGFKAEVEFARSIEEAAHLLSSDIFGDHIDLILMDYDLGPGAKGDEGLVEVRNRFSYKDIVFYTARASDLMTLVAQRGIQGVFCSTREELPETVAGVFNALVKKVLDIDHSRGIVLGTTSDIDQFINDAILTILERGSGELRTKSMTIASNRLKEIRVRFEEDFAKASKSSTLQELFDMHNIYTSVDRVNLLRKLLVDLDKHHDHAESLKAYAAEAIPRRNVLAHVRVRKKGFSRKLYNRKGEELTSETMKDLRLALLQHHEALEALSNLLRDNQA